MRSARIIVCEKNGRWAALLRAMPQLATVSICESRMLSECAARLRESPTSVLVIETAEDKVPDLCRWLVEQTDRFAGMRSVIVVSPRHRAAEAVLRTAGAHHVVGNVVELNRLSYWIARHIAQAPSHRSSVRQWTWARLPWPTTRSRAADERLCR
jgi:phosphoserine phosphatase